MLLAKTVASLLAVLFGMSCPGGPEDRGAAVKTGTPAAETDFRGFLGMVHGLSIGPGAEGLAALGSSVARMRRLTLGARDSPLGPVSLGIRVPSAGFRVP